MNRYENNSHAFFPREAGKPAACNTKQDKSSVSDDSFLPKGFVPGENDIVIGRSMKYYNHSGNRKLRALVAERLEEYAKADKSEKSFIISEVMDQIRVDSNNGAGFLKLDPASGLWYKVGEYLSREKVSQTFRDALGNYRSSSQCKKERRKMERAKAYAEAEMRNAKRQRLNMNFARLHAVQESPLPAAISLAKPAALPALVTPPTNSQTIVPEGKLFDMLAAMVPANCIDDANALEPTPLRENVTAAAGAFEPSHIFNEPAAFDAFEPLAAFASNQNLFGNGVRGNKNNGVSTGGSLVFQRKKKNSEDNNESSILNMISLGLSFPGARGSGDEERKRAFRFS